jgi:LmbE family N-acetylglucosaminyl deacetylase
MKTLVIAPHPDDELLGCGGTLLRRKAQGAAVAWLLVTGISEAQGWDAARVQRRDREIDAVRAAIGFDEIFNLRLPTTRLDELPAAEIVRQFSAVFSAFAPTEVLMPHWSDVHSDHRVVFDAGAACTKSFRYPSVRRVLAYETLSETDFGLLPHEAFAPNYFVDISGQLEAKIAALRIYESELGAPPFPRSIEAVRALVTCAARPPVSSLPRRSNYCVTAND